VTYRASVVVLGYRGRSYLKECLSSALDQSVPRKEYEVVYADNGSPDGSLDFVRDNFPSVRRLDLKENHGFARGYNLCLPHVSGAVVIFLSQDTEVHKQWLSELLLPFADANVVVTHPAVLTPWAQNFATRERTRPIQGFMMDLCRLGYIRYRLGISQPRETLYATGCSLAARREWLDQRGYAFEERFHSYAEDLEIALSARMQGRGVVFSPSAIVYHDHRLNTSLTPGGARKTVRIIRNRILSFYLHATPAELVPLVGLTVLGAPFNSSEFGLKGARRLLYTVALVPAAILAALTALPFLSAFTERRRLNLSKRVRPGTWLLREVVRRRS
jgi:GT2 family glycosyltransferase